MAIDISNVRVLYISGLMRHIPNHNYDAFNRVAKHLRDKGYAVFNPAENNADLGRETLLRIDAIMVAKSDAIVVLPGWRHSEGACMEVAIAKQFKMPILNPDLTEHTDTDGVAYIPFERFPHEMLGTFLGLLRMKLDAFFKPKTKFDCPTQDEINLGHNWSSPVGEIEKAARAAGVAGYKRVEFHSAPLHFEGVTVPEKTENKLTVHPTPEELAAYQAKQKAKAKTSWSTLSSDEQSKVLDKIGENQCP